MPPRPDINGYVDISVGAISTTRADAPVTNRLRIEDAYSNTAILEIEFTSEDLMKLLRGQHMSRRPAWLQNGRKYAERVGKRLIVKQVPVTDEIFEAAGIPEADRTRGRGYGDSEEPAWVPTVAHHVLLQHFDEGYTEASVMYHNTGPAIHLRGWRTLLPSDIEED